MNSFKSLINKRYSPLQSTQSQRFDIDGRRSNFVLTDLMTQVQIVVVVAGNHEVKV